MSIFPYEHDGDRGGRVRLSKLHVGGYECEALRACKFLSTDLERRKCVVMNRR